MDIFNIFKKKDSDKRRTHDLGGCIVTRSLLNGSSKLKWIFREKSCNAADNGWRAIGDTDTQEYLDDPNNSAAVDFDRLVEIEPAVLSIYSMPVGTDLEYDGEKRVFIESATGRVIR